MGNSGCGAGAVPSKQAKQTSKGLVFDAVRVRWRCGAGLYKQRFGLVWCGGGAKQTKIRSKQGLGAGAMVRSYLKARFRCLVPMLGGSATRISKVKVLGSCAGWVWW